MRTDVAEAIAAVEEATRAMLAAADKLTRVVRRGLSAVEAAAVSEALRAARQVFQKGKPT